MLLIQPHHLASLAPRFLDDLTLKQQTYDLHNLIHEVLRLKWKQHRTYQASSYAKWVYNSGAIRRKWLFYYSTAIVRECMYRDFAIQDSAYVLHWTLMLIRKSIFKYESICRKHCIPPPLSNTSGAEGWRIYLQAKWALQGSKRWTKRKEPKWLKQNMQKQN